MAKGDHAVPFKGDGEPTGFRRLPSRVAQLEMGSAGRIVVTLRDGSAQDGFCDADASRQITLTPAGELAP